MVMQSNAIHEGSETCFSTVSEVTNKERSGKYGIHAYTQIGTHIGQVSLQLYMRQV